MAEDPYYRVCAYHRKIHPAGVQWHHNLIFAGRQVNEVWCIIPLCEEIHQRVSEPEIKERVDWIMLNRATESELKQYSKSRDLIRERERLNKKLGIYKP